MKIITLTLSPAMDIHCRIDSFQPFHENLVTVTSRDSAGKGINISRALYANGVDSVPVILLGQDSSAEFREGLERCIPAPFFIQASGRVRENITIHSAEGETRISFRGMKAPADTLDQLRRFLAHTDLTDAIVTFTGSLPEGICPDEAENLLKELAAQGARLVIDSKSISLEALLRIRPWLIKPNGEEIAQYLQCADPSFSQIAQAAKQLHAAGIDYVIISLGGDGALLCADAITCLAHVPAVEAVSTIGAGDSTIAGFLAEFTAAHTQNTAVPADVKELLRTAVSFGTAACLTEGTQPPQPEEIAAIRSQVTIETL